MKCQKCGSDIDDEIRIDEWCDCPLCGASMLGFRDEMLDIAVEQLLNDTRTIEERLSYLLNRLHEMRKK